MFYSQTSDYQLLGTDRLARHCSRNEKGLLPLSRDIKTVAVIGPQADSTVAGFPAHTYPAGLQMLVDRLGGGETSVAGADASEREAPVQGCVTDDVMTDDGRVHDTDRTMFLRAYLTQLQHTNPDGVPVKGYFQRGTMENCEWTAGFGNRFGFVYVDFSRKKLRS